MIAISAENKTVERAERVLRAWAAAEPGTGVTVVVQEAGLTLRNFYFRLYPGAIGELEVIDFLKALVRVELKNKALKRPLP